MPDQIRTLYTISDVLARYWPPDFIELPADLADGLDQIFAGIVFDPAQGGLTWRGGSFVFREKIVVTQVLRLALPLLDGAEIGLGEGPDSLFSFGVEVQETPFLLTIDQIVFSVTMPPSVLGEVRLTADGGYEPVLREIVDPDSGERSEVPRGYSFPWETAIETDLHERLRFSVSTPFGGEITGGTDPTEPGGGGGTGGGRPTPGAVERVYGRIGDTDLLMAIDAVAIATADTTPETLEAIGAPPSFQGIVFGRVDVIYAAEGASDFQIQGFELAIGTGGLSGTIGFGMEDGLKPQPASRDAIVPAIASEVLERPYDADDRNAGLPLGAQRVKVQDFEAIVQRFAIVFEESVPVASDFAGHLKMPLVDRWFRFHAAIAGPDGDFLIDLGGAAGEPLLALSSDWLEIKVDTFRYLTDDGVHYFSVNGSIRPILGDVDLPWLKVEDLRVDTEGNVDFEGGWLAFDEARTIDFGGFKVHIEAIGFGETQPVEGSEPREQWVGFSGGITLVEGIPLAASVEGLEARWNPEAANRDVRWRLDGVTVSLTVPNAFELEGSVSFVEEVEEIEGVEVRNEFFRGRVRLAITALGAEVDARLLIGKQTVGEEETILFATTFSLTLPAPILLGATGLGIYGFTGLVGINVAPDRREVPPAEDSETGLPEPESWYEWYKRPAIAGDNGSRRDVTRLEKWGPKRDEYAFGAGISLGTTYDGGTTLNLKALLAILIPGPVVIIEGTANILKRSGDDTTEGAFYALVVFDGREETFQINIDVRYVISDVLEIGGGLEAFFDFADSRNWYVNIGVDEPRSKRLRAKVLSIVRADTYFMVDSMRIAFGADIGVDWRGKYGPVELVIVARLGFGAAIHYEPFLFEGLILLEGGITLKVFGIGFGLEFYVMLAGQTPDPFFITGTARVKLNLPWPLPKVEAEVSFRWGNDHPPAGYADPVVLDLKIMHHLSDETAFVALASTAALDASALSARDVPVVPVDCTPMLQLSKPASWPGGPVPRTETVDEYVIWYDVDNIRLSTIEDGTRRLVRSLGVADPEDADPLVLTADDLLPDPDAEEPALRLWRYSAYDRQDRERLEDRPFTRTPCQDEPLPSLSCIDWLGVPDDLVFRPSFMWKRGRFSAMARLHGHLGMNRSWSPRVKDERLELRGALSIRLPEPAGQVEVHVQARRGDLVIETALFGEAAATTVRQEEIPGGIGHFVGYHVVIEANSGPGAFGGGIDTVLLLLPEPVSALSDAGRGAATGLLESFCYQGQSAIERARAPENQSRPDAEAAGSQPLGTVLKPDTLYEVEVAASASYRPEGGGQVTTVPTEAGPSFFYFRTGGIPGSDLNLDWADTAPDQLATYIGETAPEAGAFAAYRNYDLAIELTTSYARTFFGDTLRFRVVDTGGNLLSGAADDFAWSTLVGRPLLDAALVAQALGRHHDECEQRSRLSKAGAPKLYVPAPQMRPRRKHVLHIDQATGAGRRPVSRVPFTTSAFATAVEHLTSGADAPDADGAYWQRVHRLERSVPGPHPGFLGDLTAAQSEWVAAVQAQGPARDSRDVVMIADARQAALGAFEGFMASSRSAHAVLRETIDLALDDRPEARGRPKNAVECVTISIEGGGLLLWIRSPEPLDARRWSLRVESLAGAGSAPVPVVLCWSPDQAEAFVVPADGSLLRPDEYTLTFAYDGGGDARMDVFGLTEDGAPVSEAAILRLNL